jgi:hypothetical protein
MQTDSSPLAQLVMEAFLRTAVFSQDESLVCKGAYIFIRRSLSHPEYSTPSKHPRQHKSGSLYMGFED